jgi:hypothetical protein
VRVDGLAGRLVQVLPQVEAIGYLDRVRSSGAGTLGISASPISANDLNPWVLNQPLGKRGGLPVGQSRQPSSDPDYLWNPGLRDLLRRRAAGHANDALRGRFRWCRDVCCFGWSLERSHTQPVFGQIMTCQDGRELLLRGEAGPAANGGCWPPATTSARSSGTPEPPDWQPPEPDGPRADRPALSSPPDTATAAPGPPRHPRPAGPDHHNRSTACSLPTHAPSLRRLPATECTATAAARCAP